MVTFEVRAKLVKSLTDWATLGMSELYAKVVIIQYKLLSPMYQYQDLIALKSQAKNTNFGTFPSISFEKLEFWTFMYLLKLCALKPPTVFTH